MKHFTMWLRVAAVLGGLQDRGAGTEAERCFERALAVARRQGARLFELGAATDLAKLWQQQGRREAALNLLGPIYAWFTEGFECSDLLSARSLLDALSRP